MNLAPERSEPAQGLVRIVVVGTSGSGKTTLAKQIAAIFPVVEKAKVLPNHQ